jgi:hypothetical protein
MKALSAIAAAVVLQLAAPGPGPAPDPQHFQYRRTMQVPSEVTGQACALLDASVFAHAATESLDDLRLYGQATTKPMEIPFTVTESETQHVDADSAAIRNLGLRNGDIVFDIAMPPRPYTAVNLQLNAKNFLATARVSASSMPIDLGQFTLFDLSTQHLSRSTTLPLQESTFPVLHVTLHLTPAPGTPSQAFPASIVEGATVPPSREAQTLYTPVAETTALTQRGHQTIATIRVPAHVPVERVSFTLAPAFDKSQKNFLRPVEITSHPDQSEDSSTAEVLTGEISRVHLVQAPGELPIDSRRLSVDATLGASLRGSATVEVAIDNGDDPPLPIAAVQLEMRQRGLCFDASLGTAYTLMYGDTALHTPVYDYARLFSAAPHPIAAVLGPEEPNPAFAPRADARPYTERHPELLWIGLLAVVAALGSVALRSARRQRHPPH